MDLDDVQRTRTRLLTRRLQYEYDHVLYTYRVKLVAPVIRLCEMGGKWGEWDAATRTISLSWALVESHAWATVLEILKHEMAHQMVTDEYGDADIHGPAFKKACERLGVATWAMRAETETTPPGPVSLSEEPELRLLTRVEKLLKLATSDNENEALLAMQKVQELYAKYNLERLESKVASQWEYRLLPLHKKRVERYQSVIASVLQEHFFVSVVHISSYNAKKCQEEKSLELLGTRENVEMAEYVFHFLENQLFHLWEKFKENRKLSLSMRNSYFLGVLAGFREKLDLSRVAMQSQSGTMTGKSVALLIQKDPGLENYVSYRYPRLVRQRGAARRHHSGAYSAGKKAGKDLVLKKGLGERVENLGRFLPKRT